MVMIGETEFHWWELLIVGVCVGFVLLLFVTIALVVWGFLKGEFR